MKKRSLVKGIVSLGIFIGMEGFIQQNIKAPKSNSKILKVGYFITSAAISVAITSIVCDAANKEIDRVADALNTIKGIPKAFKEAQDNFKETMKEKKDEDAV